MRHNLRTWVVAIEASIRTSVSVELAPGVGPRRWWTRLSPSARTQVVLEQLSRGMPLIVVDADLVDAETPGLDCGRPRLA